MALHVPNRATGWLVLLTLFWIGAGPIGCARMSTDSTQAEFVSATVEAAPPLPLSAAGHVGGIVEGNPVIAGGNRWSDDKSTKRWLHETFIYRDGEWSKGPDLPRPMSDAACATDGRVLYAVGGTDGKTPTAAVLRLASLKPGNGWEQIASLPMPLESAVSEIVDGKLYVTTGFSGGSPNQKLLRLDLRHPAAGWTELAPFPGAPRSYAASATAADTIYVFGGVVLPPLEPQAQVFGDAFHYDIRTNQWNVLPGFRFPCYAASAIAVNDRQVLLAGRAPAIGVTSEDIWLIDLSIPEPKMIGVRTAAGCCFPIIKIAPNRFLMPGGEPDTTRSRTARSSIVTLHARRANR